MTHPARGDVDAYQRYFAGMDASMDQKAGFLSAHLLTDPGARILDLGCGSGALSARMAALAPNARVMGIDIDACTIAQATAAHALPNLDFAVGDAAAAWEPADAVVSCSLLHHVYTYAPRPYDDTSAATALRAHVASLRPGGLLVVRDFCRDGAPDETCILDLSDEPASDGISDAALLRDFAVRARPLDPLGSGFPLEELGAPQAGWRRFRLHRHWSAEFLLRKDYREDWEAELREEYAFWPLHRFADVVEEAGARVIHATTIHNPWVVRNRFEGRARRMDEHHRPLPWPSTNMVLVAQRVAYGQALRLRHRRLDSALPSYLRLSAWRDPAQPDGETLDLVQRPTGAVDFLPYAMADGRLRVLARNGWPRPALVMMGRGSGIATEIRSGHVVEMISLASDGADPAADFQSRSGLNLPVGVRPEPILTFLPSAGLVDEVARAFVIPLDDLPPRGPAPPPPGQTLDCGVLQSFDAAGLLRAAEVGMLPEGRLELTIRALFHRLEQGAGRWVGEPVAPLPCNVRLVCLHRDYDSLAVSG
jgi:SAM-dependent methyltransferase